MQGFEFTPLGHLFQTFVDSSTEMGVVYMRALDFYKKKHCHDRLMMVFPRGASVMEIKFDAPHNSFHIDGKTAIVIAPHLAHEDFGRSSIYDTIALSPEPEMLERLAKEQGYTKEDLNKFQKSCVSFERVPLLECFLQEYFYERIISNTHQSESISFYEKMIVLTCMKQVLNKIPKDKIENPDEIKDQIILNTLRYIESNIFNEQLHSEDIARNASISRASLFRRFKKELGLTPYAYIKKRRLDEAMYLLKSKKYNVGQIATLVGYTDFSAFTQAFKKKFGTPPSQI